MIGDRVLLPSLRDSGLLHAFPGLTPWAKVFRPSGPWHVAISSHRIWQQQIIHVRNVESVYAPGPEAETILVQGPSAALSLNFSPG